MFDHKKIEQDKVKEMLEEGKKFILLDVRTEEEYQAGHIKGAVNIPLQKLAFEAESELEDKEAMIVLYCRSGVRTIQAGMVLSELDYQNVYDMGGITSWPYEVVR